MRYLSRTTRCHGTSDTACSTARRYPRRRRRPYGDAPGESSTLEAPRPYRTAGIDPRYGRPGVTKSNGSRRRTHRDRVEPILGHSVVVDSSQPAFGKRLLSELGTLCRFAFYRGTAGVSRGRSEDCVFSDDERLRLPNQLTPRVNRASIPADPFRGARGGLNSPASIRPFPDGVDKTVEHGACPRDTSRRSSLSSLTILQSRRVTTVGGHTTSTTVEPRDPRWSTVVPVEPVRIGCPRSARVPTEAPWGPSRRPVVRRYGNTRRA